MRSPVRPRFPDRSGCRGRDLTTRVRSARRIQRYRVSRCYDPGRWQAALARSRKRRPTTHPFHCSSDNDSEKAARKRHPLFRRVVAPAAEAELDAYELSTDAFTGRIAMVMGAKNMTM